MLSPCCGSGVTKTTHKGACVALLPSDPAASSSLLLLSLTAAAPPTNGCWSL